MTDTARAIPSLPSRPQPEVLTAQLEGLARWSRLDIAATTRQDVSAALDACAAADDRPFDGGSVPPCAVVALTDPALRDAFRGALTAARVHVVASTADGAEAAAAVVWEQPEVVVVDRDLERVPGVVVAQVTAACAPSAVLAIRADGEGETADAMVSGADACWTSTTAPGEVVDGLLDVARQKASGPESRERPNTR